MVFVCRYHVTDGITLLTIPHVNELWEGTNKKCMFCSKTAKFKLFGLESHLQWEKDWRSGYQKLRVMKGYLKNEAAT